MATIEITDIAAATAAADTDTLLGVVGGVPKRLALSKINELQTMAKLAASDPSAAAGVYNLWLAAGGQTGTPTTPLVNRFLTKTADYTLLAGDAATDSNSAITRVAFNTQTPVLCRLPRGGVIAPGSLAIPLTRLGPGIVTIIGDDPQVQIMPPGVQLIERQFGTVWATVVSYNATTGQTVWLLEQYGSQASSGPSYSVAPVVTGNPVQGNALTSDDGTWQVSGTRTRQWFARNLTTGVPLPISLATALSYTTQPAENDRFVYCVTSDAKDGITVSVPSNGVVVVASAATPQRTSVDSWSGGSSTNTTATLALPTFAPAATSYNYQAKLNGTNWGAAVTGGVDATPDFGPFTDAEAGKTLTVDYAGVNGSGPGPTYTSQPLQIAPLGGVGGTPPQIIGTPEQAQTTGAAGLTVNLPGSSTADDWLYLQVAIADSGKDINTPSGWTAVASAVSGHATAANNVRVKTFRKVDSGSEPASYAITFSASAAGAATLWRIRGAVSVSGSSTNTGTGGNPLTATGFTPNNAANLVILSAAQKSVGGISWSQITGWTLLDVFDVGSAPCSFSSQWSELSTATAIQNVTIPSDGVADEGWVAALVTFSAGQGSTAPPPPPPPPPPPTVTAGPRVGSFTTSSPITVQSGQTVSALRITTTGDTACIIIPPGASGWLIEDCDLDNGSGTANVIECQGSNGTIQYNNTKNGGRGILCYGAANVDVFANAAEGFERTGGGLGSALEMDYCTGVTAEKNSVAGSNYGSDAVSFFQSSFSRLVGNTINVDIANPYGAAFTMGDMIPISEGGSGDPGHDNYVAGNDVRQTRGVPCGVFGSSGNTVLEHNLFANGIQAYNYSGVFIGVNVRYNAIGPGSFIPDASLLGPLWGTNVFPASPTAADVPGGLTYS